MSHVHTFAPDFFVEFGLVIGKNWVTQSGPVPENPILVFSKLFLVKIEAQEAILRQLSLFRLYSSI